MLNKRLISAGLGLCLTMLALISTALLAATVASHAPHAHHTAEILATRRVAVKVP